MNTRMWVGGLLLGAAPLLAQAGEAGTVYTQLGTNGLGLGYAASVSDNWAARVQYNTAKLAYSGNVGDFGSGSSMDVKFDFNSLQLLADWYPLGEGFRVTGGVVFNNNKITVQGTGRVDNNAATSTIDAEVKMSDSASAFLGLGYGMKPKADRGLGFNLDFGVMFQNPKATLNASGGGVTAAQIAAEQRQMQEAVDNLKVMPVLALGISYSF